MEEFSIELGAKLKLDSLQEQINKASSDLKPLEITINTEKSEKKITALTEQISKLNNGFKIMGNMGSLSSNLDVIDKSLRSIATVIDKINKADGFNNLGKGLSSFAPIAETIKQELSSIKTAMESFKGLNINIGLGGTNNQTAYNAANRMALAELRQQETALESAYGGFINMATRLNASNLWNLKDVADDSTAGIQAQVTALQQYINAILEANTASARGIDLTPITSTFSGSANEIVANVNRIATGEQNLTNQTNQLKGLFSSGIDAEKLTTQLDTIKVSIDNVSTAISGIKFDDSTLNSFENTIQLLNNVVNQLNQSINTLNNNPLLPKTNNLLNNNLPQQMKQSGNNAGQQFANGFNGAINGIDLHNGGIGHVNGMLQQLGFDRKSLGVITENLGNMKLKIDNIKTTMLSSGNIRLTVTGQDELIRSVQIVRDFDKETGNVINTSKTFIQNFEQQETQIQRNTTAITNYTTKLEKLRKDYEDKNAPKPIQDESHLKRLNDLRTAAINQVNALNSANKENYSSMDALAKQAISNLETEIRLLRNEEYAANQLRAKPIETIKSEQIELLRKFRAEIEASGIAFDKFKIFNIGQLSGKVNGITDKQSLMDYLNSFSVAQAEFKALQAEQKNYSQMQKASADKEKATLKEVENEYQRLIQLAGQVGSTRNQLFGLDTNSSEYAIVKQRLVDIYTEYSKLKMAFTTAYPTHNLDELNAKLSEVYYNVQRNNAHLSNQQAVKNEATVYKELLSSFDKYKAERIALSKISKDSPEYSVVSQQVNKLLGDYQKLRTEFTANYPTHNLDELNAKLQELDYSLNRVQSKKTHKLNEKELAQLDAAEVERYNQTLKRMADEQNSRIIQEENQYKELISLVNQLGTAQKELSRTKIDSPEYDTVLSRVQQLSAAYQRAKMEFISAYPTHPLDELKAKLEEIGYVIQKNNDKQLGKQQTALFNELSRVSKEMDSIQIKLQTLKSASGTNEHTEQIKELERQLAKLETVYQEVMTQINNNGGLTDNQYAKIYTDIEMLDAKLKEISASAVDAQNKLKSSIKTDISNGTLENQIQTIENDYRKLGLTEDEIAQKTQTLKSLLSTMDASDDIESVTRDYAAFGQEVVKVQNDANFKLADRCLVKEKFCRRFSIWSKIKRNTTGTSYC